VNVLVVSAHPVTESYTNHVRDRAVAALRARGHEVRVTDLYADGFEARLSLAERLGHHDGPAGRTVVAGYAADLRWARALVLVYPTWWSGPPAIVKGWIDRVWVEGVAYTLPEGTTRVRGNLRNVRRLVVVSSHGSSWWVNAVEGQVGRLLVMRAMRVLCHPLARRRWLAIYDMDRATDADRARFVARVERAVVRL